MFANTSFVSMYYVRRRALAAVDETRRKRMERQQAEHGEVHQASERIHKAKWLSQLRTNLYFDLNMRTEIDNCALLRKKGVLHAHNGVEHDLLV